MKIISDLHTHTNYSDGKLTPEELIVKAKEIGLKQISITDHNNLGAIKSAKKKARELGMNYITGVEIDVKTEFKGELFHNHILGYNFDEEKLKEFICEVNLLNKEYFEKLVKNLRAFLAKKNFIFSESLIKFKEDIEVEVINSKSIIRDEYKRKYLRELDTEELSFILSNKSIEPEIICRFIKNNLVKNPKKITDTYPTTWKRLFFDNLKEVFEVPGVFYKTALEAIEAIKNSGGIPVIAHPFLDELFWNENKKEIYIDFIGYLTGKSLNGLEIYYYSNDRYTKEEQEILNEKTQDLCRKYNLIHTCGSDCHGKNIFLGKFGSAEIISF